MLKGAAPRRPLPINLKGGHSSRPLSFGGVSPQPHPSVGANSESERNLSVEEVEKKCFFPDKQGRRDKEVSRVPNLSGRSVSAKVRSGRP